MTALLPCPFCGSTQINMTNHGRVGRYEHRGGVVYTVGCYDCGASFPGMYDEYGRKRLIEIWNTRAPTP